MTDQLISFETAKLAKKKGFSENVATYYDPSYGIKESEFYTDELKPENINRDYKTFLAAPTQSLLQRWLRDKYRIFIHITTTIGLINDKVTLCHKYHIKQYLLDELVCIEEFYNPNHSADYHIEVEQALIEALKLIP